MLNTSRGGMLMSMITCPECRKEISDKATVCPTCGYPVNQDLLGNPPPKPTNRFVFNVKLILILHICFFVVICSGINLPVGITQMFAIITMILVPVDIFLAYQCIQRARKNRSNSSKRTGIAALLIGVIVGLIILASIVFSQQSIGSDEPNGDKYTAALYAMVDIRSHLKSPESFVVNQVYVDIDDERHTLNGEYVTDFIGWYYVYVDFSAKNGFGETDRKIAFYKYNQDYERFIPVGSDLDSIQTVSEIPKGNEHIVKLNSELFNEYDFSILESS